MEKEIVIKGDLENQAEKIKDVIFMNNLIDIYERNREIISKMSITDTKTNESYSLSIEFGENEIIVHTKKKDVK